MREVENNSITTQFFSIGGGRMRKLDKVQAKASSWRSWNWLGIIEIKKQGRTEIQRISEYTFFLKET